MSAVAPTKQSITHDMILDWMLVNPGGTLAQMGDCFGYTPAWLSTVINGDLFQAEYQSRRAEINAMVAMDLPTKMRGVAAQAIEKIAEHLNASADPAYALEAADKFLHRLGYAPSKSAPTVVVNNNTQNNVVQVDRDALASAREMMSRVVNLLPEPEVVSETSQLTTTPEDADYVITRMPTASKV